MRRIAQETINRVLEEVDILDVISQYVDLKKRGQNYFGLSQWNWRKINMWIINTFWKMLHNRIFD